MAKMIEYCVIPHNRWMVVRFERVVYEDGSNPKGCSVQRGEFMSEDSANEVAALLAKAEGAKIRCSARKSLIQFASDFGVDVAPSTLPAHG